MTTGEWASPLSGGIGYPLLTGELALSLTGLGELGSVGPTCHLGSSSTVELALLVEGEWVEDPSAVSWYGCLGMSFSSLVTCSS